MGVTAYTSPDQYVIMHRDHGMQEDLKNIILEKVNYKQCKKNNGKKGEDENSGYRNSPTSQYRNKSIFDLINSCETKFSIRASWHYFECGHGKGPCDGIGGTTKRNADNAVKQGKLPFKTDMILWHGHLAVNQQVKLDIDTYQQRNLKNSRKESENRPKEIKPVKVTIKVHAVAAIADGRILTKETTCVCQQCFGDDGFKETNTVSKWRSLSHKRMKEYRKKKASPREKWLIQESNRTREYYKPTSQLNSKEKKAKTMCQKEIRETSEENPTKRKLVGIVVSGKFMRKYKMLTELKKSTNITWRTQAKRSKS
ncbi:unnamed protein product [Mytilus coruscus]|uniref:Uncharacterized protein n=1 Tax=Mytilus coruscus TaxID=42192 RepID=A0A6J8DLX8_MYTCO|nr:unnamed protein product [Mytilus coruscus]